MSEKKMEYTDPSMENNTAGFLLHGICVNITAGGEKRNYRLIQFE